MFRLKKQISNIAVPFLALSLSFVYIDNAYSVEGNIDDAKITLRDSKGAVTNPGDQRGRQGKPWIPDVGRPTEGSHDIVKVSHDWAAAPPQGRAGLVVPHVPCSSSDASKVRTIAPPDAPGARRDPVTGVPYLCLAKTPDGQPANPITYPLPDGTTIEAPAPIIVTVQDMQELGLLASTPHQERAPHTLKNYHTNFWMSEDFRHQADKKSLRIC